MKILGVGVRRLGDVVQRLSQGLDRLRRFRLGWFHHQGFLDHQRKIHRRSVESMVEQGLGHVHRTYAGNGIW